MISEHDADCGELYREKRAELVELVASLSDEQRATNVPATPAWSVQDAVAHVVGLAAFLNAGDLPSSDADAAEAWTDRQVTERRGRSVAELAAEWDREGPTFEEGLRLLGYELGSHFLGDLLQHTADVHHALGQPGLPDDDALAVGLDHYVETFHRALSEAGVGAVQLRVSDDAPLIVGQEPVVAELDVERFEAFRLLGGRRTDGQARALAWTGDPDAVVGLVNPYGPVSSPLDER